MSKKALVLIDYQQGFGNPDHWGGPRNNPDAETNGLRLLKAWRDADAPVAIVQHSSRSEASPLHPSKPTFAFKAGFDPIKGEKHIVKHENSSFVGTDLDVWLRQNDIRDLVICGITTEHCVSTTTRMAGNFGFGVRLVGDACHAWPKTHNGTFIDAQTIHDTELAILHGEFATVVSTDDVLAQDFKEEAAP
ncbi:MAG: cysteine hydrolase [Yoonia sp.]|nr:cysteine hydrolase [Yoonia sp.]